MTDPIWRYLLFRATSRAGRLETECSELSRAEWSARQTIQRIESHRQTILYEVPPTADDARKLLLIGSQLNGAVLSTTAEIEKISERFALKSSQLGRLRLGKLFFQEAIRRDRNQAAAGSELREIDEAIEVRYG